MDSTLLIGLVAAVGVLLVGGVAWWLLRRRTDRRTVVAKSSGRLSKTAAALGSALLNAWASGIEEETWARIEEALIGADVGVDTSRRIVASVESARPSTEIEARAKLEHALIEELSGKERSLRLVSTPSVVLVVGVNGTGKTTTIAKLGALLTSGGKRVVLAAADTFRAAAGEQLREWGQRIGVEVISGAEGGDPASVGFDAISSARAKGADVVIIDTAGRLHAKANLMAELSKIHRVAGGYDGVDEALLVLDATGGQNSLSQVEVFRDTIPITGIVLTKLDGTARGGIVFAIERELGVPVKYVGLGENIEDLEPFEPERFVKELLEQA